jgi:uncharacterized membrane protein
MMTDQQQIKPRMSRGLKALLIGSLTLNLLVVGLVAGAAWRFRDVDKVRPAPSVGTMLYRELSREDRRKLREHVWGGRDGLKQRRLNEGLAVTEALRAVPFDAERLTALLAEQSKGRETFQLRLQETWILRLTGMSDAERADYADRLEERLRQHKDHGRKK